MFFGLTVRFLQDTFWYEDVPLMRVSGFYIAATLLPMFLFGLYAALGTGRGDGFRVSPVWYLLLIPVLVMVYLVLTDESRHFVCYIVPEESQPNLSFHPYIGTLVMVVMILAILVVRILLIYCRNSMVEQSWVMRWLTPLFEPLLMAVFSFEFFVVSLGLIPAMAGKEVIEFYAKLYYIEAVTWEFYIYLGLVPTNTHYREIFERSTIGMQIRMSDGRSIRSENAAEVTEEQLEQLRKAEYVDIAPGIELHVHHFPEGEFLWSEDVSRLKETIEDLNRSADMLAQEGILLEEELKTRGQEAGLKAKNQIYDELTGEIIQQLRLMKEIVRKRDVPAVRRELLRRMCLLGTYVKRRCNLRLIQKERGSISGEDLCLSFQDMTAALGVMGIPAELNWKTYRTFPAEFSIGAFDILEQMLEYERFSVGVVRIEAKDKSIRFDFFGVSEQAPREYGQIVAGGGCVIDWQDETDGYRLILTEGGEAGV